MTNDTASPPLLDYSDDNQSEHVAHVLPYVYEWMLFEHTYTGNFRHSFDFDYLYGIEALVWDTAKTMPEPFRESKLLPALRKPKHKDHAAAIGFANAVYCSVHELVDLGLAEIVIEFGAPTIRLTKTAIQTGTNHWRPGVSADRAKAMRDRIAQLNAMPYAEYLKSDEWRFRREAQIEAAGGRCQLCNSDEQPLHVHHRTYANRGRESFQDLVVLCATCHENFHKSGRKVR